MRLIIQRLINSIALMVIIFLNMHQLKAILLITLQAEYRWCTFYCDTPRIDYE